MSALRYVDVHTHLTDPRFDADRDAVIEAAKKAGLVALVVNGLEPRSNREILAMAERHPVVKPALGIYPIDAVNDLLPADFPLTVERFDVMEEVRWIREQARAGKLVAIGECGLDGHWVGAETYAAQERVFEELIDVARESDLPLVIHTRKLEERAAEILASQGVTKVDFHCFGGKVKLAQRLAEQHGWRFSIPANARVNEAFKKMLTTLPPESILTETDAPYLAPQRGERNEPRHVVGTVALLAEVRGWTVEEAAARVVTNFAALFGEKWLS